MKLSKLSWLFVPIALVGCGGNNETGSNYLPMTGRNITPEASEKATKALTTGKASKVPMGANDLGFRLVRELAGPKVTENVVVSPTSIAMALGMVANGAGGETKKAFDKTLGTDAMIPSEFNQAFKDLRTVLLAPDPKVTLTVANSLWTTPNYEVKREFLGRNTDFFGAAVKSIDPKNPRSVDEVNNWVSEATEKKIPKLMEELNPEMVLLAINAVYFKGEWTDPFDTKMTADREFTTFDGKKVQQLMMNKSGDFRGGELEKVSVLQLPMGSGNASVVMVLPNMGTSIDTLIKDLNAKSWQGWMSSIKPVEGQICIPKFKMEFGTSLAETFKKLGLGIAFDYTKADFSGLTDAKGVVITQIIHKATFEMDEKGAEAAAATGVEMAVESAPMHEKRFKFIADRPFLYAIVENRTQSVLFMGVYGKP